MFTFPRPHWLAVRSFPLVIQAFSVSSSYSNRPSIAYPYLSALHRTRHKKQGGDLQRQQAREGSVRGANRCFFCPSIPQVSAALSLDPRPPSPRSCTVIRIPLAMVRPQPIYKSLKKSFSKLSQHSPSSSPAQMIGLHVQYHKFPATDATLSSSSRRGRSLVRRHPKSAL